jgi:glycosyltransferase involved in cell wall biosynthesis
MLSTDATIADPHSQAHARAARYANEIGAIDVIVLSSNRALAIGTHGPLAVYPTRSWSRALSGFGALLLARKLPRSDVITAQDPFETGLIGVIMSHLLHAPLHVQVHTDFLSPEFLAHSWKNRVRVALAGLVLRRAAHIRVVSVHLKEGIEKKYRPHARVSVLPIFVDTERFRALTHRPHERFGVSLLFVGRLEKEKRADVAIRALARARSLGIDAGLTIVGDGSERGQLKLLAHELGVADWVVCTGRQDPLEHYASANMLLVPSEYEGYGLVIIEALATGVFVLATDVGVAREAGAHIAPHDTDGFAGELCSLLAHAQIPKGELRNYPYQNFAEYVSMWAADLRLAAQSR